MNTFSGQVFRLQDLVDKLENKVKIDPIDEETVIDIKDNLASNSIMLWACNHICSHEYIQWKRVETTRSG